MYTTPYNFITVLDPASGDGAQWLNTNLKAIVDYFANYATSSALASGLSSISGSLSQIAVFHVEMNGNDSTANGSISKPFLTWQAAYNAASLYSGSNGECFVVVKGGVGDFTGNENTIFNYSGNVILSGQGPYATIMNGIRSDGTNGGTGSDAQNQGDKAGSGGSGGDGGQINVLSDGSVDLTIVTANGGNGGDGGNSWEWNNGQGQSVNCGDGGPLAMAAQ
jgi:hypothetical protein